MAISVTLTTSIPVGPSPSMKALTCEAILFWANTPAPPTVTAPSLEIAWLMLRTCAVMRCEPVAVSCSAPFEATPPATASASRPDASSACAARSTSVAMIACW